MSPTSNAGFDTSLWAKAIAETIAEPVELEKAMFLAKEVGDDYE